MELENPSNIPPKTTAELLSAGRREFINRNSYDGHHMIAIASLFDAIAKELHGTRFQWSDYNRSQWDKFVSLSNSYGGSCAFSLEPRGDYDDSYEPFKGLLVGGPVGLYPTMWGRWLKQSMTRRLTRSSRRPAITVAIKIRGIASEFCVLYENGSWLLMAGRRWGHNCNEGRYMADMEQSPKRQIIIELDQELAEEMFESLQEFGELAQVAPEGFGFLRAGLSRGRGNGRFAGGFGSRVSMGWWRRCCLAHSFQSVIPHSTIERAPRTLDQQDGDKER